MINIRKVENMSFSMEEKNIVDEDIEDKLEIRLSKVVEELISSKKEIAVLRARLEDKVISK